jgi:hypothetical protein
MRVLVATDSITTLDILLDELTARSWPSGTEVQVLSALSRLLFGSTSAAVANRAHCSVRVIRNQDIPDSASGSQVWRKAA